MSDTSKPSRPGSSGKSASKPETSGINPISAGAAARFSGLCARIASPAAPSRCGAAMSVSTKPGATTPTNTPCGASALANDWLSEFRPALLAP